MLNSANALPQTPVEKPSFIAKPDVTPRLSTSRHSGLVDHTHYSVSDEMCSAFTFHFNKLNIRC